MHIHFQARPWDLYVVFGYSAICTGVLLLGVGNPALVFMIFLVPGYVTTAALFPGVEPIDWVERMAMSVALSLAIVPLLGLALNFVTLGIRLIPVVATMAIFSSLVGGAAWMRRVNLPADLRLSLTLNVSLGGWRQSGVLDKVLTLGLVTSIALAVTTLSYFAMRPRAQDVFTAFYLLGPDGNASSYPTNLTRSVPGIVILGISNHEAATVGYVVRVDLVGVQLVYNGTTQANETIERNRTVWSWYNTTLQDGQTWTTRYVFAINSTGVWKVEFVLFRNEDLTSAFREIHLYVRVS